MRKTLIAAAAASLAMTAAHAGTNLVSFAGTANAVPTADATTLTYSFSGLELAGFEFVTLPFTAAQLAGQQLTAVSVNATLDASVDYTYADDLTIYVSPALATGGALQVGGFSNLGATQRYSWANGASSSPGTTVIDTVTLATPITFSASGTGLNVYLGNGYGAAGTFGTWTGSVSLTLAPVPEPSTWALFAAGAAGLAGFVARRRRSLNAA